MYLKVRILHSFHRVRDLNLIFNCLFWEQIATSYNYAESLKSWPGIIKFWHKYIRTPIPASPLKFFIPLIQICVKLTNMGVEMPQEMSSWYFLDVTALKRRDHWWTGVKVSTRVVSWVVTSKCVVLQSTMIKLYGKVVKYNLSFWLILLVLNKNVFGGKCHNGSLSSVCSHLVTYELTVADTKLTLYMPK